jgi:N-acetylmuramoyl-L-alanine amidase
VHAIHAVTTFNVALGHMSEITVEQGDTISGLARRHGFVASAIWNDPRNKELRDRREDPNILYPGDKVFIPEPRMKYESGATEKRHRFRKLGSLQVSIAVLDIYHQPLADVQYHFVVDGVEQEPGVTDDKGMAKAKIPIANSEVVLHLPWGAIPVRLGYLDPARTVRGMQQRLRNLGIDPGPIDGILGPKTARAIREFQLAESKAGLRPTGQVDEPTIKRLREVHDQQTLEGNHNAMEDHEPAPAGRMPEEEIDSETCEFDQVVDDLGAADDTPKMSHRSNPDPEDYESAG